MHPPFPLLFLATTSFLLGQNADVSQSSARAEDLRNPEVRKTNTLTVTPGSSESADGGEGVFQVLVESDETLNLTLSTTSNFSWDTNPAFAPGSGNESAVFSQSLTARWEKTLGTEALWDVSVQQLIYRYDRFDALDFDRTAGRTNLYWLGLGKWQNALAKNWILGAGLEWWRLNAGGQFDSELLANTYANFTAQRSFTLDAANSVSLGLSSAVSLDATEELVQRDEHAVTAAWQARWAPRWESLVFARAAFYDYSVRDDVNTSAGLSLTYTPRPWCAVTLSALALKNDSSDPNFDYENLSLGAALNLRIRF
jgi:hypothetical protein